MSDAFRKRMIIPAYSLSRLLGLLSVVLLLGRCTCMPESTSETDPVISKEKDPDMLESTLEAQLPIHSQSNMRRSNVAFSFFYIDASEVQNRKIVQTWLREEIETKELSEGQYLAFWSNYDQPIIADDSKSLRLVQQALSQQYVSIPKPIEEAERIHQTLELEAMSLDSGEVQLHIFLSPSFHDLSKNQFFEHLLEPFHPYLMKTRLLIYTEQEVPVDVQFKYSGLRSISYIQLTNADTL